MQSQNHDLPNDESKSQLPEWLKQNRWVIMMGVALVIVCIFAFCPGTQQEGEKSDLFYDTAIGAVVLDTLGNRDGQVNPGEQVQVKLRLTNTGKEPASAFDLVLSAVDTGVVFVNQDNRIHFNPIPADSSALSEDPFEFKMPRRFASHCVVFTAKTEKLKLAGLDIPLAGPGVFLNGATPIEIPVAPNFRVCVSNCILDATVSPHILQIELELCNGYPSSPPPLVTLSTPSVEVVAATLLACKSFNAGAPPESITPVNASLHYPDLGPGACSPPATTTSFSFQVPTSWNSWVPAGILEPAICFHFTAVIYSNSNSLSPTFEGMQFVGAMAAIRRPVVP